MLPSAAFQTPHPQTAPHISHTILPRQRLPVTQGTASVHHHPARKPASIGIGIVANIVWVAPVA